MTAHPGLVRGTALLLGVLTVGFLYEHLHARDDARTTGEVVDVRRVDSSAFAGDDMRFTVRFAAGGETHRFVTGRSVVGQMWRFEDLDVGGEAPVAYDSADPGDARLDTFSQAHDFTVTVAAFTALFVLVAGGLAVTGRLG